MFEIQGEIESNGGVAEEEGCPNFERSSKFIRSACADRTALKTRHWLVFFTLRALRVRIPPPAPYLLERESKQKKLPLLGAFSTKMAEEEGFEPS